jgi:hypothetical protein
MIDDFYEQKNHCCRLYEYHVDHKMKDWKEVTPLSALKLDFAREGAGCA